MLKMDKVCTENPNAFWDYVKKLDSKKPMPIPWEVKVGDEIICDKNKVLEIWRTEFEKLYNVKDDCFNDEFKHNILKSQPKMPEVPDTLNSEITLEEITKAVSSSKNRKAVGNDHIPNELLRDRSVIKILHCLFLTCFKLQLIPDAWKLAIIHPIPKESGKVIDPLKYRGLALQSCVYKLYCSVLNSRLTRFLEGENLLEKEQNGFRKKPILPAAYIYPYDNGKKYMLETERKYLFSFHRFY